MLRVTPIYGSRFDDRGPSNTPRCTLVEYGGVSVLWNVGWTETLPQLPDHQAVILSDSTLGCMGGLPLYYQKFPSTPVFATFPTVKMGQMALYDQHASLCLDGTKPPFSLEELDSATCTINSIKYAQTITLHDPNTGQPALSFTAQRAGHVVGGAFFVLQRIVDETIVVLTSTFHVARELHLDSSTLLKYGATPDVLVTYPGGSAMGQLSQLYGGSKKPLMQQPVVSQAEKTLTETVLAVLRRDGNVLLPVDASGRVLELLLLLSQHWDRHRLGGAYNLCWVGPMTKNTVDFARSQLEWMATPLGAQFDMQRGHPYGLKNVSICSSISELEAAIANGNPSCVLASGASLDCGMARDLLLKWADNQDHAIIFTDSSRCHLRTILYETGAETADDDLVGARVAPEELSELCTAGQLLSNWCQAKLEGREMDDVVDVDVPVPHREPLAGLELKNFLAHEDAARLARKKAEEKQAMLREVERAKGELRLGEEEEKNKPKIAIPVQFQTRTKKRNRFDSSLFIKFSKPLHLTFEVREEAVGIGQSDSTAKYGVGESVGRSGEILEDEYGIAVIPERFTDIVTGVDPAKFAGGSGRIGEDVKRGFGVGPDGRPLTASTTGGGPVTGSARIDGEDGVGEVDAIDESALEAQDLSEGLGIVRGRNGRPPTKVSTVVRKLEVLAEVNYIPLEGRVDARAARQSVRALQPRQVIVLGGTRPEQEKDNNDLEEIKTKAVDEVRLLADAVMGHGVEATKTPSDNETAELKVGHAAYSVRLIDTPHVIEPDPEADPPKPIELHESRLGDSFVSRFDYVATGKRVAADGSIVLAPPAQSAAKRKRQPSIYVSDGDVLLTDLRAEMTAQGMRAEYSAHSGYSKLLVNGKVVVTKEQVSGKIVVEGPLCEDFYTVRSIVCAQFITL